MSSVPVYVVSAVLCAVWQIPILATGGWLGARLLRRLGPATEHGVWVGGLILCVAVPLLPVRHIDPPFVGIAGRAAHVTNTVETQAGQGLHQASLVHLPLLAVEVLFGLWFLTIAHGALRLTVGLVRTKRLLARAEPCSSDDGAWRVWNDCRAQMGVSGGQLLVSSDIAGPVTLTFGDDALVLPMGFSDEITSEEMRAAVLHECAHMRRRDFRNNLLYQVLALPVQFHPATWFVLQQLAATREMACDAAVIAATGDGVAYGSALLRLAAWMRSHAQAPPTNAVGIFDANVLEERIMRIRSGQSVLPRAVRLSLMGLSGCVVALGVATAMASSVAVAPQADAPGSKAAVTPGVYTVGKDATAPQLISQVDPQYTQAAREAKVSGRCVIAAVVDKRGVPQNVHVTNGLRPDLDANAVSAVKQYRFKPGLHEGKPVPVQLSVVVNFQIF